MDFIQFQNEKKILKRYPIDTIKSYLIDCQCYALEDLDMPIDSLILLIRDFNLFVEYSQ